MTQFIFGFLINVITKALFFLDMFFSKIFKVYSLLPRVHDEIEKKQYYSIKINNRNIEFFCPSLRTHSRVYSIFTKEPETLDWIDNFRPYNNEIIFWDIGANIGLYSIYASVKFDNIDVFSFEPSTSNTRTLSRNISINSLSHKIKIFSLALSEKKNIISFFNEIRFVEGGASSIFGKNLDQHGNLLEEEKIKNKYNIFGTNIDFLIENNIIKIPNYIKIDVDGIEHLILNGAKNLLKNKQLKELSVELNPNYKNQYDAVFKLLKDNGFEKKIETNSKLFKNKYYKLKTNEKVNAIFHRI